MEGLGSLLLFALFFFLIMRFGCGAHIAHGHRRPQKSIDPVCGMEVDSDTGYGMAHAGKIYRFCTRRCLERFDANPEQYLGKTGGQDNG